MLRAKMDTNPTPAKNDGHKLSNADRCRRWRLQQLEKNPLFEEEEKKRKQKYYTRKEHKTPEQKAQYNAVRCTTQAFYRAVWDERDRLRALGYFLPGRGRWTCTKEQKCTFCESTAPVPCVKTFRDQLLQPQPTASANSKSKTPLLQNSETEIIRSSIATTSKDSTCTHTPFTCSKKGKTSRKLRCKNPNLVNAGTSRIKNSRQSIPVLNTDKVQDLSSSGHSTSDIRPVNQHKPTVTNNRLAPNTSRANQLQESDRNALGSSPSLVESSVNSSQDKSDTRLSVDGTSTTLHFESEIHDNSSSSPPSPQLLDSTIELGDNSNCSLNTDIKAEGFTEISQVEHQYTGSTISLEEVMDQSPVAKGLVGLERSPKGNISYRSLNSQQTNGIVTERRIDSSSEELSIGGTQQSLDISSSFENNSPCISERVVDTPAAETTTKRLTYLLKQKVIRKQNSKCEDWYTFETEETILFPTKFVKPDTSLEEWNRMGQAQTFYVPPIYVSNLSSDLGEAYNSLNISSQSQMSVSTQTFVREIEEYLAHPSLDYNTTSNVRGCLEDQKKESIGNSSSSALVDSPPNTTTTGGTSQETPVNSIFTTSTKENSDDLPPLEDYNKFVSNLQQFKTGTVDFLESGTISSLETSWATAQTHLSQSFNSCFSFLADNPPHNSEPHPFDPYKQQQFFQYRSKNSSFSVTIHSQATAEKSLKHAWCLKPDGPYEPRSSHLVCPWCDSSSDSEQETTTFVPFTSNSTTGHRYSYSTCNGTPSVVVQSSLPFTDVLFESYTQRLSLTPINS